MTPRAIRRAAERKANKLARKASQPNAPFATENPFVKAQSPTHESATGSSTATPVITIPPAALANANVSATISPLTGHVTLLPTADVTEYAQHLRDYENEFHPVGLQELNLVQTLAETSWRTRRIRALEMGIFAKGRIEFAEQFAEYDPEIRILQIEVHTFLVYEKQIRGLQLQEARLSCRAIKEHAELRRLQQERRQRENADHQRQVAVASQYGQQPVEPEAAQRARNPRSFCANSKADGFEFSNQEIERLLAERQNAQNVLRAPAGRKQVEFE